MAEDPWKQQVEAFGQFIKTQRKLAQLSLRQLAAVSEVSDAYLSQLADPWAPLRRSSWRRQSNALAAAATPLRALALGHCRAALGRTDARSPVTTAAEMFARLGARVEGLPAKGDPR